MYTVIAKTSEEQTDNYICFYKEADKIWIRIGAMEERGFTFDEVECIIDKLNQCCRQNIDTSRNYL